MSKEVETKTAKILYRTTRYGTWQPASIIVPKEEKNVLEYCIEDLRKLEINAVAITIEKVIQ